MIIEHGRSRKSMPHMHALHAARIADQIPRATRAPNNQLRLQLYVHVHARAMPECVFRAVLHSPFVRLAQYHYTRLQSYTHRIIVRLYYACFIGKSGRSGAAAPIPKQLNPHTKPRNIIRPTSYKFARTRTRAPRSFYGRAHSESI